jgi:hypothetical protein
MSIIKTNFSCPNEHQLGNASTDRIIFNLEMCAIRDYTKVLNEIFSGKPSVKQSFSETFKHFIFHSKSFLLILLICIGLIGNVSNLIVFSKKSMRKTSTFKFLLYLSALDLKFFSLILTVIFIVFIKD